MIGVSLTKRKGLAITIRAMMIIQSDLKIQRHKLPPELYDIKSLPPLSNGEVTCRYRVRNPSQA